MMKLMMLIPIITALLNMAFFNKNLLSALLSLEVASLSLVLMLMFSLLQNMNTNTLNMYIMLTLMAAEAGAALACLTLMMSTYGKDQLSSLTTMSP